MKPQNTSRAKFGSLNQTLAGQALKLRGPFVARWLPIEKHCVEGIIAICCWSWLLGDGELHPITLDQEL